MPCWRCQSLSGIHSGASQRAGSSALLLLRTSGIDHTEQHIRHGGGVTDMIAENSLGRRMVLAWRRSIRLPRASFPRGENGQSLVEFALSLPIMLGFLFGMIQVCLALYSHEYISELAREGTRYAAFHGPNCVTSAGSSCTATAAQVGAYVTSIPWPNIGGGTVSVDTAATDMYPSGELVNEPVMVKVVYIFPYHIPFVTSQSLTMTSQSQMMIVQ
jgi:Flp pilus assembly protein TadG